MARNPFKDVLLDPSKVQGALADLGVEALIVAKPSERKHTYAGLFQGHRFYVSIFINDGGKCTIGYSTGFDRPTFDILAARIHAACSFGKVGNLNISMPRFEASQLELLLEFLIKSAAIVIADDRENNYRLIRVEGPLKDKVTIKYFDNRTLQVQGVHAQLAGVITDFLYSTFSLEDLLKEQTKIYSVPLTIGRIKEDLEARVPHAHDRLHNLVRKELTSALALTKVGIDLEDYSVLTFPALRGLEGYCFQLLADEVGVAVQPKQKLGEFFGEANAGPVQLLKLYERETTPAVKSALESCYAFWRQHRHRLFHMDGTLDTTRMLDHREEAEIIVNDVLNIVDASYRSIQSAKEAR